MIQSLNPATGQLLRSFEPLTPEGVEAKLALAAEAAQFFPAVRLDQRAFWMRRLSILLESEIDELAALITAEMGKTLASAHAEVAKCADTCRFYSERAAAMLAPEPLPSEGAQNPQQPERFVRYDPIGVVLAIMPWNFPFWQVFRFLAPALMAGNVGLLKHAPNVPQCALAIEALVRRAGFPRGTFQALLLETSQVEALIADPRIAALTLTGSEAAGRAVAAQAGWFLKKTVLELGGSDAFIVLPSAVAGDGPDHVLLDRIVAAAVQARCINNGQSCIAAKRFLIHESLYEEFARRFAAAMAALRVGDPTAPTTDLGPLATARIRDALLAQIDAAVAAGGRILTPPAAHSHGNFVRPVVIAGVPRTAAVCHEETFGPLALLFPITSLDDAIQLANDTPFGLGASCWTHDPAEQQRLAAELQCGGVFFNTPVASDPRLPFGGVKHSGYGRELSAAGMREFLNAKTVVVAGAQHALLPQPSLFDAAQPAEPPAAQPVPPPPPVPAPPPPVTPSLTDIAPSRPEPAQARTRTQLKPLDTGEFRLPPLVTRDPPPLKPHAVQLKPLDTGEYRLRPVDDAPSYDDEDDTTPTSGSILGLNR